MMPIGSLGGEVFLIAFVDGFSTWRLQLFPVWDRVMLGQ